MKNFLKRLLNKKEKLPIEQRIANRWGHLVEYKPIETELYPIENMILVSKDDYIDISFEDDISDYTLSLLSADAKRKIIEIIKEDNIARAGKIEDDIVINSIPAEVTKLLQKIQK